MHLPPERGELQRGRREQQGEQHHRDRGTESGVGAAKAHAHEVVDDDLGGARRSPFGHDVDERERLASAPPRTRTPPIKTAAAGGTLLLALTAHWSAAHAATRVEFRHAFSGGNGSAVDELAADYNASQDDYELVPICTGKYDEGTTRLQAAIAGGTAPGLAMLEITRYGLFAARGALEPLGPYIEAAGDEWTSRIRPFALEASKYLGESYVVPFNVSTPVMYFNEDLFRAAGLDPEAPPATWDELLEAAKALTVREDGKVARWGSSAPPQ